MSLLSYAGTLPEEKTAEQPAQQAEERPAPAMEVPARAPDIPSDPSFKLPEGMDPLSAVLLQSKPDQAASGDASMSDDGNDADKAGADAPAATSAVEPSPPLPAGPEPAASAEVSAATSSEAAAAAPGLKPPPWVAAGRQSSPFKAPGFLHDICSAWQVA